MLPFGPCQQTGSVRDRERGQEARTDPSGVAATGEQLGSQHGQDMGTLQPVPLPTPGGIQGSLGGQIVPGRRLGTGWGEAGDRLGTQEVALSQRLWPSLHSAATFQLRLAVPALCALAMLISPGLE